MVDFGWEYPPGVSSLPGDFDKYISYEISFVYEGEIVDDVIDKSSVIDHVNFWTDKKFKILEDTIEINYEKKTYNVILEYEGDTCFDVRCMDDSEIIDEIIEEFNDEFCGDGIKLSSKDPSVEVDFKIRM
jgi:hypothetical protein